MLTGRTADSTDNNNTVLIVAIVVTVIVIFPLGLVLGLLLKWYLSKRNKLESSDQQPSSGPVYETISPPTNTIELKTNEAYGHGTNIELVITNEAYDYVK